jgi:uncharacterized membrane protein YidH (DUF202 family)
LTFDSASSPLFTFGLVLIVGLIMLTLAVIQFQRRAKTNESITRSQAVVTWTAVALMVATAVFLLMVGVAPVPPS